MDRRWSFVRRFERRKRRSRCLLSRRRYWCVMTSSAMRPGFSIPLFLLWLLNFPCSYGSLLAFRGRLSLRIVAWLLHASWSAALVESARSEFCTFSWAGGAGFVCGPAAEAVVMITWLDRTCFCSVAWISMCLRILAEPERCAWQTKNEKKCVDVMRRNWRAKTKNRWTVTRIWTYAPATISDCVPQNHQKNTRKPNRRLLVSLASTSQPKLPGDISDNFWLFRANGWCTTY